MRSSMQVDLVGVTWHIRIASRNRNGATVMRPSFSTQVGLQPQHGKHNAAAGAAATAKHSPRPSPRAPRQPPPPVGDGGAAAAAV